MRRLLLFLSLLTCLAIVQSKWPMRRHRVTRTPKFTMPMQYMHKGPENFHVPNAEFCQKMSLQPAQHYLVHPWWYHHCQNLYERNVKKNEGPNYVYRHVLEQAVQYKKRNKLNDLADNVPRIRKYYT